MTGCNNGWEKWYGSEYHKMSPSHKQHIDDLKKLEKPHVEDNYEEKLDDYEDEWEDE